MIRATINSSTAICSDNDDFYITITQNGCTLSAIILGREANGTITSNGSGRIDFDITYPEDNGMTSETGSMTLSGTQATGTSNWNYNETGFNCSGTSSFSGSKK